MKPIISDDLLQTIVRLSDREYQIFTALGTGHSVTEIANLPGHKCSFRTVSSHQENLKVVLEQPSNYKLRELATRFVVYKEQFNLKEHVLDRNFIRQPRRTLTTL